MTITPISEALNLFQRRLDRIEQALARIQRRLESLPIPDPILFPKVPIDREKLGGQLYCSFCGKNQDEVIKLIAGPTVFICDGCISLCMEIIEGKVS